MSRQTKVVSYMSVPPKKDFSSVLVEGLELSHFSVKYLAALDVKCLSDGKREILRRCRNVIVEKIQKNEKNIPFSYYM